MNRSALDIVQSAISNVVNKYLKNDARNWDAMYRHRYASRMEAGEQRPRHYVIHGILSEKFDTPGTLLDVGCGVGTSFESLRPILSHYEGLDLSEEAIAICRSKFGTHPAFHFEAGDFLHKQFARRYDAVLFNESLYYFPLQKIEAVIAHARSLLNPKGKLVISMSKNPKSSLVWSKLDALLKEKIHDISIGTAVRPGRWRVRSYRPA